MRIHRPKGFHFHKELVILNKKKDKILFGIKFSVGKNAYSSGYFGRTSNWIELTYALNRKSNGSKYPGIFYEWNIKANET